MMNIDVPERPLGRNGMFDCDGSACNKRGECANNILRQKAHVRADATPVRSSTGGKKQTQFEEGLLSLQDADARVLLGVVGKRVPAVSIAM
jgi:hypothetical protein